MRKKTTFQPRLSALEDRCVPATILNSSGHLNISNQTAPLIVETTAVAGQIRVTDGAKVVLLSGVNSQIVITGTNLADSITFRANVPANKAFGGNLIINSGNGNDTVSLSGQINGSVFVSTGLGVDKLTALGNDVKVGGSLSYSDSSGFNTVDLNGRNFTVGGNLTATGVGTFQMGAGNTLAARALNLTANSPGSPLVALFNGLAVNVATTVQLTGGALNDVVSVASDISVGSAFNLNLGNGNNTFVLTPTATGSGVNGSLSYFGGTGVDVIVFGANSDIGDSTTITMGDGINTFVDTATSNYASNLYVSGGNDTNTVVVLGSIAGDFNNVLGNGDGNTTVFVGSLAGRFFYRIGNGTLGVLTIAPAVASNILLYATFGTGDSTLTLGPNVTLFGAVIGTGGSYTFNQGTAILADVVFINYP